LKFDKEDFKQNFEFYIAGIFLTATVGIVIMNVFTRYVLGFTFPWAEEIPVDCFVWTIFLGAAGAFKHKMLMGVDFLLQISHGVTRDIIELLSNILVFVISVTMCIMSFFYVKDSDKITAVLCISYKFINVSIIIAFFLISIYSVINLVNNIKKLTGKKNAAEVPQEAK